MMLSATSKQQDIIGLCRQADGLSGKGEYQKALSYYERCLTLLKDAKDVAGQIAVLHEIASLYQLRHEYDSALQRLDDCLNLANQHDEAHERAVALHRVGHLHYLKGDGKLAYDYFHKSMIQSVEVKDYRGWALSRAMMGEIQCAQGHLIRGMGLMIEALNVLFEINARERHQLLEHVRGLGKKIERSDLERTVAATTDNSRIVNELLREEV